MRARDRLAQEREVARTQAELRSGQEKVRLEEKRAAQGRAPLRQERREAYASPSIVRVTNGSPRAGTVVGGGTEERRRMASEALEAAVQAEKRRLVEKYGPGSERFIKEDAIRRKLTAAEPTIYAKTYPGYDKEAAKRRMSEETTAALAASESGVWRTPEGRQVLPGMPRARYLTSRGKVPYGGAMEGALTPESAQEIGLTTLFERRAARRGTPVLEGQFKVDRKVTYRVGEKEFATKAEAGQEVREIEAQQWREMGVFQKQDIVAAQRAKATAPKIERKFTRMGVGVIPKAAPGPTLATRPTKSIGDFGFSTEVPFLSPLVEARFRERQAIESKYEPLIRKAKTEDEKQRLRSKRQKEIEFTGKTIIKSIKTEEPGRYAPGPRGWLQRAGQLDIPGVDVELGQVGRTTAVALPLAAFPVVGAALAPSATAAGAAYAGGTGLASVTVAEVVGRKTTEYTGVPAIGLGAAVVAGGFTYKAAQAAPGKLFKPVVTPAKTISFRQTTVTPDKGFAVTRIAETKLPVGKGFIAAVKTTPKTGAILPGKELPTMVTVKTPFQKIPVSFTQQRATVFAKSLGRGVRVGEPIPPKSIFISKGVPVMKTSGKIGAAFKTTSPVAQARLIGSYKVEVPKGFMERQYAKVLKKPSVTVDKYYVEAAGVVSKPRLRSAPVGEGIGRPSVFVKPLEGVELLKISARKGAGQQLPSGVVGKPRSVAFDGRIAVGKRFGLGTPEKIRSSASQLVTGGGPERVVGVERGVARIRGVDYPRSTRFVESIKETEMFKPPPKAPVGRGTFTIPKGLDQVQVTKTVSDLGRVGMEQSALKAAAKVKAPTVAPAVVQIQQKDVKVFEATAGKQASQRPYGVVRQTPRKVERFQLLDTRPGKLEKVSDVFYEPKVLEYEGLMEKPQITTVTQETVTRQVMRQPTKQTLYRPSRLDRGRAPAQTPIQEPIQQPIQEPIQEPILKQPPVGRQTFIQPPPPVMTPPAVPMGFYPPYRPPVFPPFAAAPMPTRLGGPGSARFAREKFTPTRIPGIEDILDFGGVPKKRKGKKAKKAKKRRGRKK